MKNRRNKAIQRLQERRLLGKHIPRFSDTTEPTLPPQYENTHGYTNKYNAHLIPQVGGTCWLVAILTSIFLSDRMNACVNIAIKRRTSPGLDANGVMSNLLSIASSKNALPVNKLLEKLSSLPNFNKVQRDTGYYTELYINRMLNFLGIRFMCVGRSNPNRTTCHVSPLNFNIHMNAKTPKNLRYQVLKNSFKASLKQGTLKSVDFESPEVIIVHTGKSHHYLIKDFGLEYKVPLKLAAGNHAKRIMFNRKYYRLDAVVLHSVPNVPNVPNKNSKNKNRTHAVAGVTHNNERYVYNGWNMRSQGNTAFKWTSVARKKPCPLFPLDWSQNTEFCLSDTSCELLPFTPYKETNLCFNTIELSVAIYVLEENFNRDSISKPIKGEKPTSFFAKLWPHIIGSSSNDS